MHPQTVTYEGWKTYAAWSIALRINNEYELHQKMLAAESLATFLRQFTSNLLVLRELHEHFRLKRVDILGHE